MKRFLQLLLLISASASIQAQTTQKWEQVYGGAGNEYGYSVKTCPDSGYIVAGSNASGGISDGYVVRTDDYGLAVWSKYYGGNNVDVIRSIRVLPDSGFIMAGFSNSNGNGGYDGWVIRADHNGDTIWTRFIGTPDWDFFYDVVPTYDSGFVLAGGTYGLGNGDEDMYFVKIDKNGNTVWTKTYGGVKTDEAQGIIQAYDSMIVACGYSMSLPDTTGESWILRMDQNGDTSWTRTIPTYNNGPDKAWGIADMKGFGKFLIAGETSPSGDQNAYFCAMLYDGTYQYDYVNGIQGFEYYSDLAVFANGGFVAVGGTENDGGGNGDFFVFSTKNNWFSTSFGTTSTDLGYGVDTTHDHGYILCGYTDGYNCIQPNVLLIKVDSLETTTGVLSVRELLQPEATAACRAYPNPSGETTTVWLDSKSVLSGAIELGVYDLAGQLVKTVPNGSWRHSGPLAASCTLDLSDLPDGTYILQATGQNGCSGTGKLVVIH